MKPKEIKRLVLAQDGNARGENARGEGVQIVWNSEKTITLSSELLRTKCPCASCEERRGSEQHSKPLGGGRSLLKVIKNSKEEELDLVQIWPVGNYALGMKWGDGHDSGIYTFQLLAELSS